MVGKKIKQLHAVGRHFLMIPKYGGDKVEGPSLADCAKDV